MAKCNRIVIEFEDGRQLEGVDEQANVWWMLAKTFIPEIPSAQLTERRYTVVKAEPMSEEKVSELALGLSKHLRSSLAGGGETKGGNK